MERQKTKIDWFNFFDNFYPTGFWLSFEKASTEARVTERSRDLKIDSRLHTMMRIFKNRFRNDLLLFRNMTRHTVCQNVLWGPLGINQKNKLKDQIVGVFSLPSLPTFKMMIQSLEFLYWPLGGSSYPPNYTRVVSLVSLVYLGAISLFWNSHGF